MLIYKKRFSLGKGLSFSSYIQKLDEIHFSHYTLIIEKIPATENYRLEMVFIFPIGQLGVVTFPGGTLINDCKIKYSNNENEFTLLGSIGTSNLVWTLFLSLPAVLAVSSMLFITFTKGISLVLIIVFAIVAILSLTSVTSTYFREKKLLDRIGSLGMELENK